MVCLLFFLLMQDHSKDAEFLNVPIINSTCRMSLVVELQQGGLQWALRNHLAKHQRQKPLIWRVLERLSTRQMDLPRGLLGILNANRKIRKRTDTDVAFTREYSRVSIFHRERECTN